MAFSVPKRRLTLTNLFDVPVAIRSRPHLQSLRHASDDGRKNRTGDTKSNPVLDAYRKQYADAVLPAAEPAAQKPKPGDISASSIFEDDLRVQRQTAAEQNLDLPAAPEDEYATLPRDAQKIARTVDLDPKNRERYERKKVIQMIRNGGRLTQKEVIKRTERDHLLKSHMLKTSQKKLGMIARQIAGKPIEEAILQMRFSKKKVAIEVAKQLEAARDEAIVIRGMGLGSVKSAAAVAATTSENDATDSALATLPSPPSQPNQEIQIRLKDGKRHTIRDPHTIYIDQAWIGRGTYGKAPDYRARGRVYMLRTPWTSISVVLKEEQTRIREYEAREAKQRRRALVPKDMGGGLWTHLPDRPVQWQRPWYTF